MYWTTIQLDHFCCDHVLDYKSNWTCFILERKGKYTKKQLPFTSNFLKNKPKIHKIWTSITEAEEFWMRDLVLEKKEQIKSKEK